MINRYMSAENIKRQLQSYRLVPNKALGQNFLADDAAVARIADAACASALPVLEIGPGLGALTAALVARAPCVAAVELDAAMVDALLHEFEGDAKLEIIHADFLKFDLEKYVKTAGAYCAAGNLPYYATTPICMRLLTCPILPERMVLMVQKEAAARFTAKTGTKLYGPLAALLRVYYNGGTLMTLSPASFYPQPEVDSAVLTFARKGDARASAALPKLLEAAFSMRRKTLLNNLRSAGMKREEIVALLTDLNIPENARPEQIAPELFAALAERIGSS